MEVDLKSKLLLFIIILSVLISGCGSNTDTEKRLENNGQTRNVPQHTDKDPLREQINQMTIDEKIGQMVIVGLDGSKVMKSMEMIEKYKVGGLIFKRNIIDASQTLNLINSLKDANGENKFPLFLQWMKRVEV